MPKDFLIFIKRKTSKTISANNTINLSFFPFFLLYPFKKGPELVGYTNYEVPTAPFTTLGAQEVVIRSTENSAITVALTVTVTEMTFGTYTLRQTTDTYNANPTLADFTITKSDAAMDDFSLVESNNFRIAGTPNTTHTMLGRNNSEGGFVTFTFPAGSIVTEVKLNDIIVDTGKTPTLKINDGVSFTYSEDAQNIVLKPYANTIKLSTEGTSRIWFHNAEFTIKNVNDAALDYGQFFLDRTGAECSALAVLSTTWDDLKLAYQFADANVKDIIDAAAPLESGNALEQALLRYNYIVTKYAYNDFLQKGLAPVGGTSNDGRTNMISGRNALLILGTISVVTILGLTFLKRKKA